MRLALARAREPPPALTVTVLDVANSVKLSLENSRKTYVLAMLGGFGTVNVHEPEATAVLPAVSVQLLS